MAAMNMMQTMKTARLPQYRPQAANQAPRAAGMDDYMSRVLPVHVHQMDGSHVANHDVHVPMDTGDGDKYVQSEMNRMYGPAATNVNHQTGVMHLQPVLPALPNLGAAKSGGAK